MNYERKIRNSIFEALLEKGKNRKNWEMLCCSEKPLVPFIGAGMSAWCYRTTWEGLLEKIVAENYSQKCVEIVRKALEYNREGEPGVSNTAYKKKFYWMEEIAECIFEVDKVKFEKSVKEFQCPCFDGMELSNEPGTSEGTLNPKKSDQQEIPEELKDKKRLLKQLRYYIGEAGTDIKSASVKSLHRIFDQELLYESGKMPEYQSYFHKLFPDILITTNYDKALEVCYPSLFSYSYKDFDAKHTKNEEGSWIYQAVMERIEQMKKKMEGEDGIPGIASVPDKPMLLKVHGSLERVEDIALTRKGYDEVYNTEMPEILKEIFQKTSVVFLGYSLGNDRVMDILAKVKEESGEIRHFAFLPREHNEEKQSARAEKLEKVYGVYPVFYDKDVLPSELFRDEEERAEVYHDYCLGLLMENLLRRKSYYPHPLEELWDEKKYEEKTPEDLVEDMKKEMIRRRNSRYVRRNEALHLWKLLNYSEECPLIAITGEPGSGRSTFCKNIMELQKGNRDAMQFFYISLRYCTSWQEFCTQVYQTMNIIDTKIPEQKRWREVAKSVNERCSGYWKSVLIFDYIDELKNQTEFPRLWETIKSMLRYWRNHHTRVMIICQKAPEDLPCHVWRMGKLKPKDAGKVFFSSCTLGKYRDITYLEKKVVHELIRRQKFKASTVELLGIYANSKSNLTSLLEEWDLNYHEGDTGEQTVTRMLWTHLKDEHQWQDASSRRKKQIEENIIWIWGILAEYPGAFPKEFFKLYLSRQKENDFKNGDLSRRTLMFLKNIGLCQETAEEEKVQLLKNITTCIERYFLNSLNSNFEDIKKEFQEKRKQAEEGEIRCGMEDFRSYRMDLHQAELREYILQEEMNYFRQEGGNAKQHILDILECIGNAVSSNEMRKENEGINVILRYEIKTVVHFLNGCLEEIKSGKLDEKEKKEWTEQVIRIGCSFLHYYHYAPQQPLIFFTDWLLQKIQQKQENFCLQAEIIRVIGDLQKRLGKKKEAYDCYCRAVDLCNRNMIASVNSSDSKQVIRVKAGAELMRNNLDSAGGLEQQEHSRKLYGQIGDLWGEAYCCQRKGERILSGIELNQISEQNFLEIRDCFNRAEKLFSRMNHNAGIAYLLKAMGDLISICNKEYNDRNYRLVAKKEEGIRYYQILNEREIVSPGKPVAGGWENAAVTCYLEAFWSYYSHINWQGFANVLQGMGTCYRTIGFSGDIKKSIQAVERLYGLAEECYRWLGDERGLADTLEYFGYGYQKAWEDSGKNSGSLREIKYFYMALSKWMESRINRRQLGNEEKLNEMNHKIRSLKKDLKEQRSKAEDNEQKGEN